MNTKSNVNHSRVWLALAALGLFASAATAEESASDLWRKSLSRPAKVSQAAAESPGTQEKAAQGPAQAKASPPTGAGAPAQEAASPPPASAEAKPSESAKNAAAEAQEPPAKADNKDAAVAAPKEETGTAALVKAERSDRPRALAAKKDAKDVKEANAQQAVKQSGKDAKQTGKDVKPNVTATAEGAAATAEKPVAQKTEKGPKAEDLFVLPYEPGEGAQLAMQATEAWVEVYAVEAKDSDKAMQTLLAQDTPPALGVVADDTFYASTAKGEFEAPIAGYQVTRKGKELAYDVDCAVTPQKGDELRADFTSGPWQVRLQGKLTAHFVFGAKNIFSEEIVRLPGLTAENCHLVDEQRLVYQGKLTLSKDGKPVSSRDVMFQSVTPQ